MEKSEDDQYIDKLMNDIKSLPEAEQAEAFAAWVGKNFFNMDEKDINASLGKKAN